MISNFFKIVCLCLSLVGSTIDSFSQNVAINNTGTPPNSNAMLDVQSSNKGILIPRIDYLNRPQNSVETGMLIYVTNNGPFGNNRFYYYNGTKWLALQHNENKQTLSLSNDTLRISDGNYVVVGDILNLIGYYNCGDGYTQVNTDKNNCGACGTVCTALANGTSKCENGTCMVSTCNSGYGNCDGLYPNGCETNLNTSITNCGACNNVCTVAHGTPACSGGSCAVASCSAGYGNCNGLYADGCETNLTSSVSNCGACYLPCGAVANGSAACVSSTCAIGSCNAGFANCNGLYADGCEINTTSNVTHCGGCNKPCGSIANGTTACESSSCTIGSCNAGWGNCNGVYGDGCETNINTSLSNCGACNNTCSVAHGTPVCSSGACAIASCSAGYANCNGLYSDGCETNTTSNVNHCGACNNACASIPNGSSACTGSTCTIGSCFSGYANCNGVYADGCETNITNNNNHCGSCGTVCPAGKTCVSGLCK